MEDRPMPEQNEGFIDYYRRMVQSSKINPKHVELYEPEMVVFMRRDADEPLIPAQDVLQLQKWFAR
jgi:hypothetical protein